MKLEDIKHNHTLTDLLKILLFSILMLAPILSIATKCAYVVVNKNAYQSYSDVNDIQLVEGTSSNLLSGNTIYMNYDEDVNTYTYGAQYYYSYCSIDWDTYTAASLDYEPTGFRTYSNGAVQLYNSDTSTWTSYLGPSSAAIWGNTVTNVTFTLSEDGVLLDGGYAHVQVMYYTQGNLDNVFEYSVSQIEDIEMFNWTQSTAVYTGVETMTSNLGITQATIPIILTYWFLLTVIYVIIDIMLKGFITLTHMLGKKT